MTYEAGQWNAICDRCGSKYKARQLRREWTGLRTCHGSNTNGCWEPRHPQESTRGKADKQATAWSRPETDPVFLTTNEVTPEDL